MPASLKQQLRPDAVLTAVLQVLAQDRPARVQLNMHHMEICTGVREGDRC